MIMSIMVLFQLDDSHSDLNDDDVDDDVVQEIISKYDQLIHQSQYWVKTNKSQLMLLSFRN